ncbi:MAG: ArnT family glycosyltransferase [Solirubrobacteraceae bacterium]
MQRTRSRGLGAVVPAWPVGRLSWPVAVTVIVLVALALRVPLALTSGHLFGDPSDYQRHAVSIATGHGYPTTQIASSGTPAAVRPPAYPYLVGGLYALVGIHPDAARLLSAVLGVITVLLIVVLAEQLWGRRVAVIAGAIAAICPSLIALNSTLLSESLFLPLEVGTAIAILALRRGRRPVLMAALVGALCALSTLTRSVAILWLLPAVVAVVLAPASTRRRVAALAAMLGTCLVLFLPWAIRDAAAFRQFVPLTTQGGLTLAGQYNPQSGTDELWRIPPQIPSLEHRLAPLYHRPGGVNEAQLNGAMTDYAVRYIRDHPGHVPVAIALNTLRLFNIGDYHQFTTSLAYREMSLPHGLWSLTTIGVQLITVLAIVALVGRLSGRLRVRLGTPLVWAVPLLALIATVPTNGSVRYRAPLDPFLILLAAVLLGEVFAWLRPSAPNR